MAAQEKGSVLPSILPEHPSSSRPVYLCAPMVRYSKLPFRKLARKYGADLVFTPMIIAKSFWESEKAREAEFTTDEDDKPLIVQFAANNGPDLAKATEFIIPYSDGVDLNCGCPQRWAMQEGLGSQLIFNPELIADMVRHVRRLAPDPEDFSVSVKIRIDRDLDKTVDLCRMAEAAGAANGSSLSGVNFLTVHARTPWMRHEPVVTEAFKVIKDSLHIPVFANGDIRTLKDAEEVCSATGVDGVMAARGMLHNPAMFTGATSTPLECVKDWVDLVTETGLNFSLFHHQLMFMLDRHLPKAEKKIFNRLQSAAAVMDFLERRFQI